MPWPPRSMLPPPRRPSHPDHARRPAVARRRTLRPPRKASDRSPEGQSENEFKPRPVVVEQGATCDVDDGSALVGQSAAGEHIANEVHVAGLTLRAWTHHARRPASVRFGPHGPALRAPRLGIIRLLRQLAVLRSDAAKQDLEVLPVSAGRASLVRRRPAQITSRFVRYPGIAGDLAIPTEHDCAGIAATCPILAPLPQRLAGLTSPSWESHRGNPAFRSPHRNDAGSRRRRRGGNIRSAARSG